MSYFKGKNLELIESLVYNPNLKPSYEFIKNCLVWSDEVPDGLTPEGYEKLIDLLIIRSFIHRQISPSNWWILDSKDSKYFQEVWSKAIQQNFKWPGMNRLKLTKSDQEYYKQQQKEALEMDYL